MHTQFRHGHGRALIRRRGAAPANARLNVRELFKAQGRTPPLAALIL